jgi:hypothetical protein
LAVVVRAPFNLLPGAREDADDFLAVGDPDLVVDRLPALEPFAFDVVAERLDDDRDELRPERLSDPAPFELATLSSRINSNPVAAAPSTIAARSKRPAAARTRPAARGNAATLLPTTPLFRLWRRPAAPDSLEEAATMTVAGPTLTPRTRVFIVMSLLASESLDGQFLAHSLHLAALARR